jgi:hypothetical protein
MSSARTMPPDLQHIIRLELLRREPSKLTVSDTLLD